jgi:two-component system phosphate regulon response regulator PhoB
MLQPKRLLVVEDERDLAEMLAYNLKRAGYQVSLAHDGAEGLNLARQQVPDLVLLDIMLPAMSGIEVARQLRTDPMTSGIGIVMLTARAEETDQVAGLAIGADDYVTKPFSMKVLLARVEALLRRAAEGTRAASGSAGSQPGGGTSVRVGPVEADLSSHRATVDGQEIKLTLTEFRLLVALLQTPKRVLTRSDLITRVMGPGIVVTARTIDVHIAAIRKKLGEHGPMIRTVRGVGYQLSEDRSAGAELEV